MSNDPFESPRFSLRRANRHSQEFSRLLADYFANEPYTLRTEFNAPSGRHQVHVKVIREPTEDLRGCASDAVKNIRDALDQAVSAATLIVTGKRPRRTHFPFGENEADLEASLSGRKAPQCRDIPEELFPAFRHIKPYPHHGDQWQLKSLQRVSGPHKHTVSLSLRYAPPYPMAAIQLTASDPAHHVSTSFHDWDGSKDEFVMASFAGPPGVEMNFSHAFSVAFDHAELRNIPALTALDGWGARTAWIIDGLERYANQVVAERGD